MEASEELHFLPAPMLEYSKDLFFSYLDSNRIYYGNHYYVDCMEIIEEDLGYTVNYFILVSTRNDPFFEIIGESVKDRTEKESHGLWIYDLRLRMEELVDDQ